MLEVGGDIPSCSFGVHLPATQQAMSFRKEVLLQMQVGSRPHFLGRAPVAHDACDP